MSKPIKIKYDTKQIDFEGCKSILLDTCTLLNLYNDDQLMIKVAKEANEKNIVFGYSVKSVEEISIISEKQNIPDDKRVAVKNMQYHINQSQEQGDRIFNKIHKLPNMLKEPVGQMTPEMIVKIKQNQTKHKLRWGDASILTMAEVEGFDGLMTHDNDYKNIECGLKIFNVDKLKR